MRLNELLPPAEPLGATYRGGSHERGPCDFLVWAPNARRVDLYLAAPDSKEIPMAARTDGYFFVSVDEIAWDSLYRYHLFPHPESGAGDEPLKRADPASRHQPQGVHGPSQVIGKSFAWRDAGWEGPELVQYIIYELHVGTATAQGTFEALTVLLPELKDLGVTALELMPVAEFPGMRNWGYDGVYPFAAHHAYGGPAGLKQLVDACHRAGLAVIMDVVYNHLGPEGNYLDNFGPYFTDVYTTPWGRAVNFDGPYSDQVRRYFLENARYWIRDCHIDALRVDAVHGIFDFSARPFLAELTQLVRTEARRLQRRIYCIAESDLNDTKIIRRPQSGGLAFDAQWNDDFHHALHTLLTGERNGYYADFGQLDDLAKAWRCGYVYDGRHSVVRRRRHGSDACAQPAGKFVVFSQNHDQVGNRMRGERLSSLVTFEQLKLAAACVLLSPYIPLLFMGEDYAETVPFSYFVSHTDPDLVEAVREGRRREFSAFDWMGQPPDPQALTTFQESILTPALRKQPGRHATLFAFYRELIALRKTMPALAHLHRDRMKVTAGESSKLLCVRRRHADSEVCILFHFGSQQLNREALMPAGSWRKRLDSAEKCWLGPGSRVPASLDNASGALISLAPWQGVLWQRPGLHRARKDRTTMPLLKGDQK